MKYILAAVLFTGVLTCTGIAAEPDILPAILSDLGHASALVLLDDTQMEDVQGTGPFLDFFTGIQTRIQAYRAVPEHPQTIREAVSWYQNATTLQWVGFFIQHPNLIPVQSR